MRAAAPEIDPRIGVSPRAGSTRKQPAARRLLLLCVFAQPAKELCAKLRSHRFTDFVIARLLS
jgi:hypothetical protein